MLRDRERRVGQDENRLFGEDGRWYVSWGKLGILLK